MINERKEFIIRPFRQPEWSNGLSIYLHYWDNQTHKRMVPENIKWRVAEEGEYVPTDIRLDRNHAQELMDELWRCGLRPTEGNESAGSLAATQHHLHDMQKIAYRLLDEICPATKPNS